MKILKAVATAASVLAAPAPAAALPNVLADAETGRVYVAEDADAPWRPASLVKMMTAHLALKAVESGRLRIDAPLTLSARAAAEPPSKSGLKAGARIPLGDALAVMMVKSANDLATAVAERVSGSVEAFSGEMNAEAARLGMSGTRYANANGLDAPGQVTTARDVAVLAVEMHRAHARRAAIFAIPAVSLGGRTFENTNNLLGRVAGIDGMKTGYTCPSGFNLAATASLNGRRLVAVVLGAATPRTRGVRALSMLERAFAGAKPVTTLAKLRSASPGSPRNLKPLACGRNGDRILPPLSRALTAMLDGPRAPATAVPLGVPSSEGAEAAFAAALEVIAGGGEAPSMPEGMPALVPVADAPASVEALKPVQAPPTPPLPSARPSRRF